MAIFFTADTHFGHANIIKYCGRPFQTKEQHDEALISNWNSVVSPKDHVYHLGDVGFGSSDDLYRVLQKLKGKIYLIRGNHDGPAINGLAQQRFQFIKDIHVIKTQHKGRKIEIFLSHYAHRTWLKSNHGTFHLFGHSHGNMPPHGLSFDVGVDCWNFTPVSMDQIVQKMDTLSLQLDYKPRE
jgi:calcineurin-like phosphoesterase family protein